MALPALLTNYINYGNGSSTGHYAVTAWATGAVKAVGALVRQSAAPSVGNERVFVCVVAGTTHATTEPTWTVTRGAKTTDNTVTWQECTGQPTTNGDMTNTIRWSTVKNTAVSLGVIIKDSGTNLFICTTAGTAGNGSEPTWSTTVGNTTADNTVTWTCISNAAFSNWAAPHARVANAVAANWGSAGDDFYVASAHAETQSTALTITSPGTAASPCRFLCVNAAGSMPPVSADLTTGATISTTGASAINLNGYGNATGIAIQSGSAANAANIKFSSDSAAWCWQFLNSQLTINNTSNSSSLNVGNNSATDQLLVLNNTPLSFGSTGQKISVTGGRILWKNTASALLGAAVPTTLLTNSAIGTDFTFIGVDLSAAGSGKSLFNATQTFGYQCLLIDCKLGASVSITTGSIAGPGSAIIRAINSDSTNTNYRCYKQTYQGTITHETTIVRSGGASDGTTSFSRKMVSAANSKFYSPLESDPIYLWNDTTGSSKTLTIPVITDNVTLKDNDAWVEVEYLGTSGFPIGSFANDGAADVLNAGTNQATDSASTWTTTGLTTPVKQTLDVTFTPQMKGLIKATVKLAKVSTTMYYDPKIQLV